MGRGSASDLDKKFVFKEIMVLKEPISLIANRTIPSLIRRYKLCVICILLFLMVYAGLTGSTKDIDMDPPPLPSKTPLRSAKKPHEFPDFEDKYDKVAGEKKFNDRNVKEAVHNRVDEHFKSEHNNMKDSLIISNDREELPREDLTMKNLILKTHFSKLKQKQIHNAIITGSGQGGDSIEWAAVGGADMARANAMAAAEGYDEFALDISNQVPGLGERGEPVILSGREGQTAEQLMKTEAFNLIVSDKISYTRDVPDTRDPRCQAVYYDKDLPTTSVIIIFTNEAWSPLIRTIWSVLNRSPAQLIHEIILVDDFSDKPHLGVKLEKYIEKFLPPKIP